MLCYDLLFIEFSRGLKIRKKCIVSALEIPASVKAEKEN